MKLKLVIYVIFILLLSQLIFGASDFWKYGCENTTSYDSEDACYLWKARSDLKFETCDLIQDEDMKNWCYNDVVTKILSKENCDLLEEKGYGNRDLCFRNLANREKNFRYCNEVRDEKLRNECLIEKFSVSLSNIQFLKRASLQVLALIPFLAVFVLLYFIFFGLLKLTTNIRIKNKKIENPSKYTFYSLFGANIFLFLNPWYWFFPMMGIASLFQVYSGKIVWHELFGGVIFMYVVSIPLLLLILKNKFKDNKTIYYITCSILLLIFLIFNILFFIKSMSFTM